MHKSSRNHRLHAPLQAGNDWLDRHSMILIRHRHAVWNLDTHVSKKTVYQYYTLKA
ncbi:MAG: hypothetical protein ABIK68_19485 [bacterium]